MPHFNEMDPAWKEKKAEPSAFLGACQREKPSFDHRKGFVSNQEGQDTSVEIEALKERVEALERLIKLTFNGHVLINGQFVDVARATKSIL